MKYLDWILKQLNGFEFQYHASIGALTISTLGYLSNISRENELGAAILWFVTFFAIKVFIGIRKAVKK